MYSESVVTLFPLPGLAPPTPLIKAKAAFSFALHTHVSSSQPDGSSGELGRMASIPTVETYLLVGCRRKAVIYSWKDGEAQEVKVMHMFRIHSSSLTHFSGSTPSSLGSNHIVPGPYNSVFCLFSDRICHVFTEDVNRYGHCFTCSAGLSSPWNGSSFWANRLHDSGLGSKS